MGADKPTVKNRDPKKQAFFWPLFAVIASLLVAVAIVPRINFESEGDRASKLNPQETLRLLRRLNEIDDSEQYALVAKTDGWYPCLHSGRTAYYLKTGEVWKYGVTSKGQLGRYSAMFFVQNKVSYIIEFKGSFSECLKREQIQLFHYPYLPENLARPLSERLPRPPYNRIMR